MVDLIIKKIKPKESNLYKVYWEFAAKRQNIFFNRIAKSDELISDEILKKYKFTNAYRASDRVSQYLIRNVIYKEDYSLKNLLFRILLFKTFNKIETWEYLEKEFGNINYEDFNFENYDKLLSKLRSDGLSIYSGAYIMTSGKTNFGHDMKHQNHLKLLDFMFNDNLSEKVEACNTLEELFYVLKKYPTIGDFLAYQYAIDINYSSLINFDEMEFVFPGPGAKDGIKKCFISIGEYNESDVIKYVADRQNNEFKRFDVEFKSLWGRKLQLIDCQNLFCEVDKYARVSHPDVKGISGRLKIKQVFTPKKTEIDYWYPPKWNINQKIKSSFYE